MGQSAPCRELGLGARCGDHAVQAGHPRSALRTHTRRPCPGAHSSLPGAGCLSLNGAASEGRQPARSASPTLILVLPPKSNMHAEKCTHQHTAPSFTLHENTRSPQDTPSLYPFGCPLPLPTGIQSVFYQSRLLGPVLSWSEHVLSVLGSPLSL